MYPTEKESSTANNVGGVGVPNKVCCFNLGSTTQNTWNKSEWWIALNISCWSRSYHITRPITSEFSSDAHSLVSLCPMQLLTMKSRVVMPPSGEFQKEGICCRKQWRCVQHLANEFWGKWKKEVYATLQVYHKWNKTVRNFKVEGIVLL